MFRLSRVLPLSAQQRTFKMFAKTLHPLIGGSSQRRGRIISAVWKASDGYQGRPRVDKGVEVFQRSYAHKPQKGATYIFKRPIVSGKGRKVRRVKQSSPPKAIKVNRVKKAKRAKKAKVQEAIQIPQIESLKRAMRLKKSVKALKISNSKMANMVKRTKKAKMTKRAKRTMKSKVVRGTAKQYLRFYWIMTRGGHIGGKTRVKRVAKLWRETRHIAPFTRRVRVAIARVNRSKARVGRK